MKQSRPIYVIAGKEESLVNAQCSKLLDQLIEPSQRAVGLSDADPAQVSISEVLDELRTLPFLSEKRVVVLKGADKFVSENREALERYFEAPCPTGILVLTVSGWPANTKLAKKLPKVGKLLKVKEPRPWQLPRHLIGYARDAHDKRLTQDAAEILVELAGDNLPRLYSEIDKLALFADAEEVITPEHVELLVGRNRLYNAFAAIDACLAGRASDAVNRLRNMFAEDRSAEYTVIGAFAFHFRRAFRAKALLDDGIEASEVARRLHIWGNKDGFFTQVRKMTLEQIGSILQQLAETDSAIKTGRAKAQVAVEQLVLELTCPSGSKTGKAI